MDKNFKSIFILPVIRYANCYGSNLKIYKLFILCRYQGKSKTLMYDVTKIITALKGKRGDHRVFRLAENVCLNLIFSLRDFFLVKRDGKVFALVSKL
jgi:hypothetical protein